MEAEIDALNAADQAEMDTIVIVTCRGCGRDIGRTLDRLADQPGEIVVAPERCAGCRG